MPELVCFGELMLRLSAPGHLRFAQAREWTSHFGGAEANVAVTVAQLGGNAGFITRLPQNEIADSALAELRGAGVDVSSIVRGGGRMGVYFVEHGVSLRPSKVVYDRAHSSMAEAAPGHFDWESILAGARWLHWSGITPALSPAAAEICLEACQCARSHGLTVSFDLNFRSKLWSASQAGQVLSPLMEEVDLCITSAEEAQSIFDLPPSSGEDAEEVTARALCERFGFQKVALTSRRAETADQTQWSAMLYAEGCTYRSPTYHVGIVDRLGAGDCFSGALLFALLRGDAPKAAIDLAVAASTLKHTTSGDFASFSLEEVTSLQGGSRGGRVQR